MHAHTLSFRVVGREWLEAFPLLAADCSEALEDVFAEIDIDTFRTAFKEARNQPEKIPAGLKALAKTADFPEKLVKMVEKAAA